VSTVPVEAVKQEHEIVQPISANVAMPLDRVAPPAVVVSAQLKQLGGLGDGLQTLQALLQTDAGPEMEADVMSASETFVKLIRTIANNAEALLVERRENSGK